MSIDTGMRGAVEPDPPGAALSLECAVCGFQGHTVAPGDAVVAIRSLPRRYRAAMTALPDDADREAVLHRSPGNGWWSAVALAGHVRDVLHSKEKRLLRVYREDDPVLAVEPENPPSGIEAQGSEMVLATLQMNAEQLARTAESVQGDDWLRTGRRDGSAITAVDLLREAVHEGVHHLRDINRAIQMAIAVDLR